jgi:mercuric ion transport protein
LNDRSLITAGAVGAALAAICCATPLLGGIGLTAWLAKADYVALAVLILALGLMGLGLYRRSTKARAGS